MSTTLSLNTQAILLLTAPLKAGRNEPSPDVLSLGEYKRLARFLYETQHQPAELIGPESDVLINESQSIIDRERLARLLARGFLLSQAVERWQARGIWIVSRADAEYPARLKTRLKENAPPIIYGSGDIDLLNDGGLAVVGSRNVDEMLIQYAENIGHLTARADRSLISGGARGIDQAAMRGALNADGRVVGILADSLEQTILQRDYRDYLMNHCLALISPYDPGAGFNVGNAMQRNKLIYALADAGLVVSSDYQKGGTWAGAVEQLEKLHLVPVYVRVNGTLSRGIEALQKLGARVWPEPDNPNAFVETIAAQTTSPQAIPEQSNLLFSFHEKPGSDYKVEATAPFIVEQKSIFQAETSTASPAEVLFAKVRELLQNMETPKTDAEVAEELQISRTQARDWLLRLVAEGVLEKLPKPVRYRSAFSRASLFEQQRK